MWLPLLYDDLPRIESLHADAVVELGLRRQMLVPSELAEKLRLFKIGARILDLLDRLVDSVDRDAKYFDILPNG